MSDRPDGFARGAPSSARRSAVSPRDPAFDLNESGRHLPFALAEPLTTMSGVVFSSPHSGRAYFKDFVRSSRLDLRRLRASEDAYVDLLFDCAAEFGAPLISAVAPRAYVDLNRCPSELDPNLLDGAARRASNARVAAGLGVVPRIVAEGVPIYDGKLKLEHALARIRDWHDPYHRKLTDLLEDARNQFGHALLIDCHSMPSGAVAYRHRRGAAVDIVLGDRFGASCQAGLIDAIEDAFADAGFRVERNTPFAGGYITERFGQPGGGVSAVQIEIDRGIYLEQSKVTPSADFDTVRHRLRPVIRNLCGLIGGGELSPTRLAAE